jgi:hypothetical protein
MPIRFYCPFCHQVLRTSSQTVGAVIECPSCRGKVGVPRPDSPPPLPGSPGRLDSGGTGIVLTPAQLEGLVVVFLLLAGLAFAAGVLVGALS